MSLRNASEFVEVPFVVPNYLNVLPFETLQLTYWRKWTGENRHVVFYTAAVYLALVFAGQKIMENRRAFGLRRVFGFWNTGLALFSLFGFARSFPELLSILSDQGGFHSSVCIREKHNEATAFWGFLFIVSKFVELGDTAFILLRKKRLIFLHWYHHVSVMIAAWLLYESYEPPFRYFVCVNYFIHTIMYAYFALAVWGIKVPKKFAMTITFMQIAQMILGLGINFWAIYVKALGGECAPSSKSITIILAMYGSYFVLFAIFFRDSYFQKKTLKKE